MTVIMIGGMLFMATTVAGLLMFYQIQSSTSFEESTKAFYAADAGLEAAIYYYFYDFAGDGCYPNPCNVPPSALPDFSNGTEITRAEILIPPPSSGNPVTITARGESGRTARLLQITFSSSL